MTVSNETATQSHEGHSHEGHSHDDHGHEGHSHDDHSHAGHSHAAPEAAEHACACGGHGDADLTAGPPSAVATELAPSVVLSDPAAVKVRQLLAAEGRDDLALRVAVQPGGCSGLRYQLFFDDRQLDGDVLTDFDGVKVVVDRMSNPYLQGASIDFVDTIEKQGFTIDNPNAGGSCACGESFH